MSQHPPTFPCLPPALVPALLEAMPDYVGLVSGDGTIAYINRPLFGLSRETVIGQSLYDFMTAASAVSARACMAAVLAGGSACEAELETARTETPMWFLVRFVPVAGEAGQVLVIATPITEYRQTLQALEASQRRLDNHIRYTPLAAISFGLDLRIAGWNPAAERLFGWSRAEALGCRPDDLMVRPQDRERMQQELASILASRESAVMVYACLNRQGQELLTRTFSTVILDADGQVAGIETLIEDITEQSAVVEQLRQSRELLRSHLDHMPLASINLNVDGTVAAWNQAAEFLFGWTAEEAIGQPVLDLLIPPEQREAIAASLGQIYAGGSPRNQVVECLRRDGTRLLCHTFNTLLYDRDGRISAIVSLLDDVTEREQLLQELEASRRQLAALLHNTPLSVIIWDSGFRVRDWNTASEQLYGYAREEALGRSGLDLIIAPEHREQAQAIFDRAMSGGELAERGLYEGMTRDGRRILTENFNTPIRDAQGQVVAIASMARDVTTERQLQQALEEAKQEAEASARAKSEFLANMSHEIRTPMHGIIGAAELLTGEALPGSAREYAEIIRTSARSLLAIINDVLDFSKIEAGALSLESVPFDAARLLTAVHELLAPLAQEKGLQMQLDCGTAAVPVLLGDPLRIQQILINLVGNAIKFTPAGHVRLQLLAGEEQQGRVPLRMRVQDTGIGIAANKQQQVFEHFAQGDGSVAREFGGTGLGLAISQRLAHLMGGAIALESVPGEGATFTLALALPRARDGLRPENDAVPVLAQYPLHVLIVDDNPVNLTIGARLMESLGLRVDRADNGPDAIRLCRRTAYDLVFMDIQMPMMSGLDAARQIRRLSPLTIVAMTANVQERDRQDCQQAGMSDFLTKPFRQQDLVAVLERFLQARGQQPAGQ